MGRVSVCHCKKTIYCPSSPEYDSNSINYLYVSSYYYYYFFFFFYYYYYYYYYYDYYYYCYNCYYYNTKHRP